MHLAGELFPAAAPQDRGLLFGAIAQMTAGDHPETGIVEDGHGPLEVVEWLIEHRHFLFPLEVGVAGRVGIPVPAGIVGAVLDAPQHQRPHPQLRAQEALDVGGQRPGDVVFGKRLFPEGRIDEAEHTRGARALPRDVHLTGAHLVDDLPAGGLELVDHVRGHRVVNDEVPLLEIPAPGFLHVHVYSAPVSIIWASSVETCVR